MLDTRLPFGLVRPPFAPPASPDQAFLGGTARGCVPMVIRSLLAGQPAVALSGPPGIGKTVLLDMIADAARTGGMLVVRAAQPYPGPTALQQAVAVAAGLSPADGSDPAVLARAVNAAGRTEPVVLLVDDAHALSAGALQHLWLLSRLFRHGPVRLHLVLAGRPGLEATLNGAGLESLRAATGSLLRVPVLADEEVGAYLDHRLRSAGSSRRRVMAPSAVAELSAQSGGVPGQVDLLASRALGLCRPGRRMDRATVDLAVSGADAQAPAARRRMGPAWLVAGGLAAAGVAAFVMLSEGGTRPDDPPPVTAQAAPNANGASPLAPPPPVQPEVPPEVQPEVATAVPDAVPEDTAGSVGGDDPTTTATASLPEPVPTVEPEPVPTPVLAPVPAPVLAPVSPPVLAQPVLVQPSSGLVLVAGENDSVPLLYRKVYRGLVPPSYAEVAALNPAKPKSGDLLVFPTPPSGWGGNTAAASQDVSAGSTASVTHR